MGKLIKLGFEKKLIECDEKTAAAAGLVNRPLTTAGVRKHLEDLGLEAEYGEHVCPEKWRVYDHKNHVEGQDWGGKEREKVEWVQPTEQVDAFGNVTKVKNTKKKLSRQEQKQKERRRKAKIAAGEPLSSDDEDDL